MLFNAEAVFSTTAFRLFVRRHTGMHTRFRYWAGGAKRGRTVEPRCSLPCCVSDAQSRRGV